MTPVRDTVVAVRDTHFVRSFHITNRASAGYDAFIFLKQAATTPTLPNLYPELPQGQTTLGQFFPEVPSRYGPMNYIRVNRQTDIPAIQQQGLVPQQQDTKVDSFQSNQNWEAEEAEGKGLKQFNLDDPGFFLTKPHPRNIEQGGGAVLDARRGQGLVGVRMTPEEARRVNMQTRTADESPEDIPEAFVQESIPSERLVIMPQLVQPPPKPVKTDWHDQSTWNDMTFFDPPAMTAFEYGIDDEFVDRNAPPDAQGRAFNFDELGEY